MFSFTMLFFLNLIIATYSSPRSDQWCVRHSEWMCNSGQCILREQFCDGKNDCYDKSDETHCVWCGRYIERKCNSGQCILRRQFCDGKNDCYDKSDEANCGSVLTTPSNPKLTTVLCDIIFGGYCYLTMECIPPEKLCDGHADCPDNSDELNCKGNN